MLKQPSANFKKMKSFMPKPINAVQRPNNALRDKIMASRGGGLVHDPIRSIMPIPNPRQTPGGMIGARPIPNPNPRPILNRPTPGSRVGGLMPNPGGIRLDPREWGGGGGFDPGFEINDGRDGRDFDPGFQKKSSLGWGDGKNFDPGFSISPRPEFDPIRTIMPNPGFDRGIQLDPREWGGNGGFPGNHQPVNELNELKRRRMVDLFSRQRPNPGMGIFPQRQQY